MTGAAAAEGSHGVVGYVRLVEVYAPVAAVVGSDWLEVERLVVDPDRWGEGIGEQLLGHARASALAHGRRALLIVLGPNTRARRLYERCGRTYAHQFAGHDGTNLVMLAS